MDPKTTTTLADVQNSTEELAVIRVIYHNADYPHYTNGLYIKAVIMPHFRTIATYTSPNRQDWFRLREKSYAVTRGMRIEKTQDGERKFWNAVKRYIKLQNTTM